MDCLGRWNALLYMVDVGVYMMYAAHATRQAKLPTPRRKIQEKSHGITNMPTIHARLLKVNPACLISLVQYNMFGLHVFATLNLVDYVDIVIGSMLKLPSSKSRTISLSGILTEHSLHKRFCRIRRQYLIAILDNTDCSGFGGIDMLFGSSKLLCIFTAASSTYR